MRSDYAQKDQQNLNQIAWRFLFIIFLIILYEAPEIVLVMMFAVFLLYYKFKPEQFAQAGKSLGILIQKKNQQSNQHDSRKRGIIAQRECISALSVLVSPFLKKSKSPVQKLEFLKPKSAQLIRHQKYLQIALNSTLKDAHKIICSLPNSPKIIIEAGTPLIKRYGAGVISHLKNWSKGAYVIADIKTADLGEREVEIMARAGAEAITCLGVAPIETIDNFISTCERYKVDAMIDMMNVSNPLSILQKLKKLPKVVILHRGVDETELNKEKTIPYYQIKQIKGFSNNILVSVAGGDDLREVESAIFNEADIVVVWKNFMQAGPQIKELAQGFLQAIK